MNHCFQIVSLFCRKRRGEGRKGGRKEGREGERGKYWFMLWSIKNTKKEPPTTLHHVVSLGALEAESLSQLPEPISAFWEKYGPSQRPRGITAANMCVSSPLQGRLEAKEETTKEFPSRVWGCHGKCRQSYFYIKWMWISGGHMDSTHPMILFTCLISLWTEDWTREARTLPWLAVLACVWMHIFSPFNFDVLFFFKKKELTSIINCQIFISEQHQCLC